jgi:O-acetyl-ADP-ribose deacetylase
VAPNVLYSFKEFVEQANRRLAEIDPGLEVTERMARYYTRRHAIRDGRRISELPEDVRAQLKSKYLLSSDSPLRGNIRFYDDDAVEELVDLKLSLRTKTLDELGFPALDEEVKSLRSSVRSMRSMSRSMMESPDAVMSSSIVDPRIQESWQVKLSSNLTLNGTGPRPSDLAIRNLARFVADNFPTEDDEEPSSGGLQIDIELADIAAPFAGAIVNASNAEIRPGGGVAGRIWDVCGHKELMEARRTLVGDQAADDLRHRILRAGEAVWTTAGRGAERGFTGVIHACGPRWASDTERDSSGRITPDQGEDVKLRQTWRSVLRVADEQGVRRLAAPMISTGIFGFPTPEGYEIAFETLVGTETAVENVVFRTNSRRVFDQLVAARQRVLGTGYTAG